MIRAIFNELWEQQCYACASQDLTTFTRINGNEKLGSGWETGGTLSNHVGTSLAQWSFGIFKEAFACFENNQFYGKLPLGIHDPQTPYSWKLTQSDKIF